ncbi:MAG: NAD(P)H-quinone oxidoreductase [Alkalilacustris sp.]
MTPTVPDTMSAILADRPGGPEVLSLHRLPTPCPGAGEVQIRVAAAGVNRPDLRQRAGGYPPPPGVTEVLGLEVAGTVTAIGAGVDAGWLGREVCALLAGGGYAEYCVAPLPQVLPVPRGLDMVQAAALPETVFTVWTNLFGLGRLAAGERVLIHGGASGIGTTAIQLARAFGAEVLVTAGTEAKCDACRGLGAARAINYRTGDFVAEVMEATGGAGVDVILDMVCAPYLARNLSCLAPGGRLVIIAFLGGGKAELDVEAMVRRRQSITGSTLRPQSPEAKGRIAAELRERVWPLIEAGRFVPVIQQVLPLAQAAEAHALLEAGDHVGKFVLTT